MSDPDGFSDRAAQFDIESTPLRGGYLGQSTLDDIGRKGDAWLAAHAELVASFPAGTVIMIEVASGNYETAKSYEAARTAFRSRFGPSAPAHVHRVGMPIRVGGAWWPPN